MTKPSKPITVALPLACFLALLAPVVLRNGNHQAPATRFRYVAANGSDGNDGSAARPWATLQHAVNAATPGDTVVVGNGTYIEAVSLTRPATQSAPITLKSQNRWGAKIIPTNRQMASNSRLVISISGAYNTLEDFDVDGAGDGGVTASATGIKVQRSATGSEVLGNHVHNIGVTTAVCREGAAIAVATSGVTVDRNYIHDVSPPRVRNFRCNSLQGIYFTTSSSNGIVTNNIIFKCWQCEGMQFDSGFEDNTVVANNTVFNVGYEYNFPPGNYRGSGPTGGAFWYNCGQAYVSQLSCGGNKINNNIFEHIHAGNCIHENSTDNAGNPGGTFRGTDTYANNLIYDCTPPSTFIAGTLSDAVMADALFVNYTGDEAGDYSLQPRSPAIDAGTVVGAPPADYNGVPRPQGLGIDIGAYEYNEP